MQFLYFYKNLFQMYGSKIRMIRELRGFSQEHVATKLGIAQTAYSRIETNQTKLSTEMLEKLAKELGVSPVDILNSDPVVVNFYGPNHGSAPFGTIQTVNVGEKELYEKIIASKDDEIARMQKTIDSLLAKK
ncbi:helix-turn-helix transcriptional regulator [Mucilaginibacter sp.]|uniref:helix-turn-helix domain-containing protein n=2 Tax=Mucilaginibacter sp. TaxID=1882438 RepID=UPI003266827C